VIVLKLAGSPGVLVLDMFVFIAAAVAGARLPVRHRRRALQAGVDSGGDAGGVRAAPGTGSEQVAASRRVRGSGRSELAASRRGSVDGGWDQAVDQDLALLQPIAHPEVLFGLTTMSFIRGLAGFFIFLLAFGLRREHAALAWYGFALSASGAGALLGLMIVGRLRQRLIEQQILLGSIWLIALAAVGAAEWGVLPAQVMLALVVGIAGSMAQPSFDALTQRFVPPEEQGRAFARFAARQQLVWCLGAIIPVVVTLKFEAGDIVMAAVGGAMGLFYVTSRQALRYRALPRQRRGSL
jgi:hypothetical protein